MVDHLHTSSLCLSFDVKLPHFRLVTILYPFKNFLTATACRPVAAVTARRVMSLSNAPRVYNSEMGRWRCWSFASLKQAALNGYQMTNHNRRGDRPFYSALIANIKLVSQGDKNMAMRERGKSVALGEDDEGLSYKTRFVKVHVRHCTGCGLVVVGGQRQSSREAIDLLDKFATTDHRRDWNRLQSKAHLI